ncbi:ezrin-like isoform X3 [Actinia tenebrosa]|nr:ezrin-like isoform X3 [Actinia tenebrosa]
MASLLGRRKRPSRPLSSPVNFLEFHVILLDNSEFSTTFESKEVKGFELFDQVCEKAEIPLSYRKYFGLQYVDRKDGEMSWLLLEKPLPTKKKRKLQSLQLAVQVFPTRQLKLHQDVQLLRILMFQLKDFISRGKLHLPINKHAILDSYFAQAELGDFNEENHGYGYLEGLLGSTFFSHPSFINSNFDISEAVYETMVTDLHKSRKRMTTNEAMLAFVDLCQSVQGYGELIHRGATDDDGNEILFVIAAKGLKVSLPNEYREPGKLLNDFSWDKVVSIMSNKSKIYVTGISKYSFGPPETVYTFRFHGHFGYLQADRVVADCLNHKKLAFDTATLEKKDKRCKSLEDITRPNSLSVPLAGRARSHSPMASLRKQMRVAQVGHV